MIELRTIEAKPGLVFDASVAGDAAAPLVLLLHGFAVSRHLYDAQVPALAERFRVVTYDTRGHGESPVPDGPYSLDDLVDDVVALLDRLGVERAHVAGLSLGGMTGMRLAAREPARVHRLVDGDVYRETAGGEERLVAAEPFAVDVPLDDLLPGGFHVCALDPAPGTERPRSQAAQMAPAAMSSLAAKMAVGRLGRSSSRLAPTRPDSYENAPSTTSAGS